MQVAERQIRALARRLKHCLGTPAVSRMCVLSMALGLSVASGNVFAQASGNFGSTPSHDSKAALEAGTDTLEVVGTTSSISGNLNKCAEVLAKLNWLREEARQIKLLDTVFLEPLGRSLTVSQVGQKIVNGNYTDAAQTGLGAIVDETICIKTPKFCPAWAAGRALGEIINLGPKLVDPNNRSLNEMWTDYLSDRVLAFSVEVPADVRLLQLYRENRRRHQEAKAALERETRANSRCSDRENAIDAAVAAALGRAQGAADHANSSALGLGPAAAAAAERSNSAAAAVAARAGAATIRATAATISSAAAAVEPDAVGGAARQTGRTSPEATPRTSGSTPRLDANPCYTVGGPETGPAVDRRPVYCP